MERILELLARMERKMDSNHAESEAERKASQEGMMAELKAIQHKWDAIEHERKAHHEEMRAEMDAWHGGVTHACLEKKEPAPEETETVAEPEEVPERATEQETIEAAEDRTGEQRLAVGCRGRLKTRTKSDGRLRQECAATVGRPTRRFVPALRKGGLRKGPGQRCCRSGIGGRSKASRAGERGMAKNNAVRETPEGRMCKKHRRAHPECDHGDQGARERLLLEGKKMHRGATRQSLRLEITKLIFECSVRLREPRNGTLWKCRPPPKRKRLRTVCVPALQNHRPPPGVLPL
jgi:hypothetical protein